MTTSANGTLSQIEDLFQSLVWNNLVDAGVATLFVNVPFLGIWPLSALIRSTAHAISNWMYNGLRLTIDLQVIAFVNNEHRKAFDDAAVKLQIILKDAGPDSPAYLEAKKNAKIALSKYVSFHAS